MDGTSAKLHIKKIKYNKDEISQIFNNFEVINNIFKQNNIKFDDNYTINTKDKKIFNFIFKSFFITSNHRNIKAFLNYEEKKILNIQNIKQTNKSSFNNNISTEIKTFLTKFINICIFN